MGGPVPAVNQPVRVVHHPARGSTGARSVARGLFVGGRMDSTSAAAFVVFPPARAERDRPARPVVLEAAAEAGEAPCGAAHRRCCSRWGLDTGPFGRARPARGPAPARRRRGDGLVDGRVPGRGRTCGRVVRAGRNGHRGGRAPTGRPCSHPPPPTHYMRSAPAGRRRSDAAEDAEIAHPMKGCAGMRRALPIRSRIAGCILRSAMSALTYQAAASVSMPSGRGWPPVSGNAGTA